TSASPLRIHSGRPRDAPSPWVGAHAHFLIYRRIASRSRPLRPASHPARTTTLTLRNDRSPARTTTHTHAPACSPPPEQADRLTPADKVTTLVVAGDARTPPRYRRDPTGRARCPRSPQRKQLERRPPSCRSPSCSHEDRSSWPPACSAPVTCVPTRPRSTASARSRRKPTRSPTASPPCCNATRVLGTC